jgi:hypothetical protein
VGGLIVAASRWVTVILISAELSPLIQHLQPALAGLARSPLQLSPSYLYLRLSLGKVKPSPLMKVVAHLELWAQHHMLCVLHPQ